MKIAYLKIENFKSIRHFEFQPSRSVNVFAGINGAGKSSVLTAIRILLSWLTARLKSSKGRGINLNENDIHVDADYCFLKMELDNGVAWQLYKQRSTNRSKSDRKTELDLLMCFVNDKIEEYAASPQNTDFTLIDAYSVNRVVDQIPIRVRKKHMLGALDAMSTSLENSVNFHSFFLWFREREDIENENYRIKGDLQLDRQLEAVRNAVKVVFPEYGDLHVTRNPMDFVISKGEHVFSFSQLSDGEKSYIALVADIARKLAMTHPALENPISADGIIIIDEIDLHLHPTWQCEVLQKLRVAFPSCQFFLSTHSPYVISNISNMTDGDKLFSMQGGEAVLVGKNVYGQRAEQVLLDVFGMKTLRNAEVQAYIDDVWKLLASGTSNQSEIDDKVDWLMRHIDINDSEFYRIALQRRMNKKETMK